MSSGPFHTFTGIDGACVYCDVPPWSRHAGAPCRGQQSAPAAGGRVDLLGILANVVGQPIGAPRPDSVDIDGRDPYDVPTGREARDGADHVERRWSGR